jgi:hypothetical protein
MLFTGCVLTLNGPENAPEFPESPMLRGSFFAPKMALQRRSVPAIRGSFLAAKIAF